MQKSTLTRTLVLPLMAVLLLTVWGGPAVWLLLLVVVPLVYLVQRRRDGAQPAAPQPLTADQAIAQYGQPTDTILLDATRANELGGVLLVYDGFFVVDGRRLDAQDLLGVTFNNAATPYSVNEYQVILHTRWPDCEYLHLKVGYDAAWAASVAQQVQAHRQQMSQQL